MRKLTSILKKPRVLSVYPKSLSLPKRRSTNPPPASSAHRQKGR